MQLAPEVSLYHDVSPSYKLASIESTTLHGCDACHHTNKVLCAAMQVTILAVKVFP